MAFTNRLTLRPSPNLRILVPSFIAKGPGWHKAACPTELTLFLKGTPPHTHTSLGFHEIRDGVDASPNRLVQGAVWFPKTKAYESRISAQENKLIGNKMRKSSYPKFAVFPFIFFSSSFLSQGADQPVHRITGPATCFDEPGKSFAMRCGVLCIDHWQIGGCYFLLTFRF